MSEVEIRLCASWEDCVQCEELQKRVWEMPDYRDAVPANLLVTAIKNGGVLVGAFRESEMVGFAFGFLGSEKNSGPDLRREGNETKPKVSASGSNRLKHTSHMLAVLPDARIRGLGAQMKWLQRAEAVRQGLELMTWTYDPLQAINGHLNLNRLGAVARRYYRNAYGEMTDGLNAGMASDRFEVEWYLTSARVQAKLKGVPSSPEIEQPQRVYRVGWNSQNLPIIQAEDEAEADIILVEIPADIAALKVQSLDLGILWRQRTRDTFERLFGAGYVATDVARQVDGSGHVRVGYVLRKGYVPEP